MTGPSLTVGRGVIVEVARLAALEVPGILRIARAGPAWRSFFLGPAVAVRTHGDRVDIRLWVIARPGARLSTVAAEARTAVAGAIERLLGLRLGSVTVIVDGIGG